MPSNKKSLQILLDDLTYEAFTDFRFSNRFSSESKAGYIVFRAGMEALKDQYPELDISTKLETGKKAEDDVVTSATAQ